MTIKVKVLKCGEDGSSLYFKLLDESDVLVCRLSEKRYDGICNRGLYGKT